MNPDLRDVAEHMKNLGLGALTHALRLSLYATPENPSWADLSVLNAAHAAEILIKARLAAEHPLLIFTQIPKSSQVSGTLLDFEDLFVRPLISPDAARAWRELNYAPGEKAPAGYKKWFQRAMAAAHAKIKVR